VIKVERISKRFYRGATAAYSVRDYVSGVLAGGKARATDEIWALRDVSFEAKEGDTLGIIGNNGAGKSTLLKILSKITKPTSGRASISGRVGCLLEVGTGFHNELSGRENIFLNGAILGMKRAEIERKFDEIVAFSEIGQFLDTPVKHYSSGMYMRLAFAVAAHLEPEVLIVDEVLAVGDIAFQRKCLGKMKEISEGGRTVLFVSHNLQSVSRLCKTALWLEKGVVRNHGETNAVVADYLNNGLNFVSEREWDNTADAPGGSAVRLRRVRTFSDQDGGSGNYDIRRPITVELTYDVLEAGRQFSPTIHLYNQENICLFAANDVGGDWPRREREKGTYVSRVVIPGNLLAEGTFFVTAMAFGPVTHETFFEFREAVSFTIYDPIEGDSARGEFGGPMIGLVRPKLDWETELVTS
jgi:lipopolysaccharide transport system ATP-binding protein